MTKRLSKTDLAYNALVDALDDEKEQLWAALERHNKLASAAEAIYKLGLHPQKGLHAKR